MTQTRLFGTLALFLGAAILVAAVLVPDQAIGRPTALIDRWFFSVGGVAAMALGICARRGALAFGVLAFFLVVGGAAQLYVTDPQWFPALRLQPQNWKEWATIGVIGAEVLVALIVLVRANPARFLLETADRLGLGQVALLILASAVLSVPVIGYVVRQAEGAYAAHVLVALILIPAHLLVMAAMTQVESPISGLYRLSPLVPATVTLIVGLILAWFAFERMPHVSEEVAYLFQAKTFAGGALTAPAPPVALLPGLDYPFLQVDGARWYAVTAPGWPLALAAGIAAGVPWLVNPLLAALSVLLAHGVANRLAGRDQADLVAMMMGASPWLLAMSASLLPHTLMLFLTLLAWWLLLRASESPRRRTLRLVLAGLAMGWVFAARPLDGLVIGGLSGLWLLLALPGGVRTGLARALPYGAGCIAAGGLALIYNARLTGNPFLQPVIVYARQHRGASSRTSDLGNQVGLPTGWESHDLWPGQSLVEAMLNTLNLAANLQFELMGWSVGSLALVMAFFLWQKPNRSDAQMLVVIAAVIASVFFFWFPESYYIGPRFWFLAAFPLFYLSARGYQALRERFPDQDHLAFVRIDSLFWLACAFGLSVFLPWRAVTKYYEFNDFHPTVREDAAAGKFASGPGGAVVLVARNGDPGSALMLNDPWLRGTIYLDEAGQIDPAAVQAALPGRTLIPYRADWTGK